MSARLFTVLVLLAVMTALAACGGGGDAQSTEYEPQPPRRPAAILAITFDEHATTYTAAFPIMLERGLVGTFFVDPDRVDNGAATTPQLRELQRAGWSIQGYSGVNMVNLLATQGPAAARARLMHVKRELSAKGFPITSLAPTQRAWNDELRGMADGVYSLVRVATTSERQAYPFPDPLYVRDGGTGSLSDADTAESLGAQLASLQARGGAWIIVVHKVGDDADPGYSVKAAEFAKFCELVAKEVAAGRLRVVTL